MTTSDQNISVVTVIHNDEQRIETLVDSLTNVLLSNFKYYEIVLVDDGSDDRTVSIVETLQMKYKNIQLYCLPRSRGEQIALIVGLENTIGDFVITLDADADPPELIPRLLKQALDQRTDMVYAIPKERESGRRLYDVSSRSFFALLMKICDVEVPLAISSYRLFSRSVLNYVLEVSDRHRTLAIAPALSGYHYATVPYERIGRRKRAKRWSGVRGISQAFDLIVSTSTLPLRLVTFMSLGISAISVVYAVVVVLIRFLKQDVASGWASISLQISGLFFLVFFILAVMSEYLIRITEATNTRPLYHISKESYSSVVDRQELNVDVSTTRAHEDSTVKLINENQDCD